MHMHACHGALACDPLVCARVFLFDTFTFPNVVPLASTIGHWDSGMALGPSQLMWEMSASTAGHLQSDVLGSTMANLIAGQTNSGVGRLGSQLPIAPTPN